MCMYSGRVIRGKMRKDARRGPEHNEHGLAASQTDLSTTGLRNVAVQFTWWAPTDILRTYSYWVCGGLKYACGWPAVARCLGAFLCGFPTATNAKNSSIFRNPVLYESEGNIEARAMKEDCT